MKAPKTKVSELKGSNAAHILDKNSKTLVKINQLLEVLQKVEGRKEEYQEVKVIQKHIGMHNYRDVVIYCLKIYINTI